MAENEPTRRTASKADQPDEEAVKATSTQYAGADPTAVPSEEGTTAKNPVDLGTDVEKLPPVPGAGQFMSPDDATEDVAPGPEAQKK